MRSSWAGSAFWGGLWVCLESGYEELDCLPFWKAGVEQIDELTVRAHQEYKRSMVDVVTITFSLDLVRVYFELFCDVLEVFIVLVLSSETDEGRIEETKVLLDCLWFVPFGVD